MKILKKTIPAIIIAVLLIHVNHGELHANSVAFGYFINKSDNRGMDYLQQLLPNSLPVL